MHTLLPAFVVIAALSVVVVASGPYWYPVVASMNQHKALAAFVVAFGLLGFPLGVFVAAEGAGLVALGVYVAACVLVALGAALWVAENIVDDATKVAL